MAKLRFQRFKYNDHVKVNNDIGIVIATVGKRKSLSVLVRFSNNSVGWFNNAKVKKIIKVDNQNTEKINNIDENSEKTQNLVEAESEKKSAELDNDKDALFHINNMFDNHQEYLFFTSVNDVNSQENSNSIVVSQDKIVSYLNLVCERIYGNYFITPAGFISTGKLHGKVEILNTRGEIISCNFNGERVYQAEIKFQCNDDNDNKEIFKTIVYFHYVCLNVVGPSVDTNNSNNSEIACNANFVPDNFNNTLFNSIPIQMNPKYQKIFLCCQETLLKSYLDADNNVVLYPNTIDEKYENSVERGNTKFYSDYVDFSNCDQVKRAVTMANIRAFSSRFIPPVRNVVKGKAYGEMIVLQANGDKNQFTFNGEIVFQAVATFRDDFKKFTTFVYYHSMCFNPLRTSYNATSRVKFIPDNNPQYSVEINNREIKEYYQIFDHSSNRLSVRFFANTLEKQAISPEAPKKNGRAFFTGLLVGGYFKDYNISKVYEKDAFSEYVGTGAYADNSLAFPLAVKSTFDGLAIDENTRVIIYEKKNFEGKILLDKTGPAIINNGIWKDNPTYKNCNTDTFPDELQKNFPPSCRIWSDSNMQNWSYGSLKVFSV